MKTQFDDYKFRASQIHKIMTGTIGLTDKQHEELRAYVQRAWNARNSNDRPLTPTMYSKMLDLFDRKRNPELPKTMQTEVKKIFLMEKYNRNFPFTNKYVQKGIFQEEEGITTFQKFLKKTTGKNVLFTKNDVRLKNDWVQGEPDLGPIQIPIHKWDEGWDIKISYTLQSFPLPHEELDQQYECQNQSYMWLTGAKKWATVYVLVNATEHQLFLEKQKWYYAMDSPDEGDLFYDEMIARQRDVEKMMIYDYDRFVELHPYHDLEISREEWMDNDWDIPLEERVVIYESTASKEWREEAKERIKVARNYLKTLENGRIKK